MKIIELINHNKEIISLYLKARQNVDIYQHKDYNQKIFELIQENINYYKQLNKSKRKPTQSIKLKPKVYKWLTFVKRDTEYEEKVFNTKDFGYENIEQYLIDNKY